MTLHAELHEQEQVLTMFATQRDAAVATRVQYDLTLQSLRQEGIQLRHFIDGQKAVTVEKEELVSRTKTLEEIHDVCRSLSAWKLTKMSATQVELVYEHLKGSSHVIQVQFAAQAPALVCNLKFYKHTSGGVCDASDFFARFVASLNPTWSNMVHAVHCLSELQSAMQSIDIEIGRMQALDQDLSSVSSLYAIPKGVQIHSSAAASAASTTSTTSAALPSTTMCSFTVHFSCLEPASKWNVGFDVKRGYPFGRVDIVPETEFGNSPTNVEDICDVAFGYMRLERACEHLNGTFLNSCASE